ncbi:hypothetical protein Taro_038963 [Colocasia esculenta]|uniref:Uncharacterized protein n=1 Tax=Colocasia esculenta TaxID=4460 RepID=A0A843W502_COLES|nr:hypothetical protein [Colocasia esculenta]
MASRGRRGGVPTGDGEQRRDEPRREDQGEQQAPAPQGPVLPPPPPVDYGVFMQSLVQAMQMQAHTQVALQAQLEAQEGEMEQYLEEKKALQKRPAAPFQRQDKKKALYQSPEHPVAARSTQNPEQGDIGRFLALPKESFLNHFDPLGDFSRGKQPIPIVHTYV